MDKMTKFLVQPNIRRIFYSEEISLTDAAEKTVLQLHLALGGDLAEMGECTGVIEVSRGDIRDWRSYYDAVTFDNVTSREEYCQVWAERFPEETKEYSFLTSNSENGLSLTITDGQSSVLLSRYQGDYMIPGVNEILKLVLADFVTRKTVI